MAKLKAAQRNKLPASKFGEPGARKYPVDTRARAINAKGRATHRSATLCFCEGELWVGDILAAKSMGTFKYLRRLDAAKRPEQPYITD